MRSDPSAIQSDVLLTLLGLTVMGYREAEGRLHQRDETEEKQLLDQSRSTRNTIARSNPESSQVARGLSLKRPP